jgi:hypothetical protein
MSDAFVGSRFSPDPASKPFHHNITVLQSVLPTKSCPRYLRLVLLPSTRCFGVVVTGPIVSPKGD